MLRNVLIIADCPPTPCRRCHRLHRDLDDLMKQGVGDEQRRVLVVELNAIGFERRVRPVPRSSSGPLLQAV
jgi:hypothetical protein